MSEAATVGGASPLVTIDTGPSAVRDGDADRRHDGQDDVGTVVTDHGTGRRAAGRRIADQVVHAHPATWVVVALVTAYTAYFTNLTLDIHHGLGTASYDSALYDQGVWLLSRFQSPFVTLMGRNLLGDHASFILFALVPVYWVFPAAGVLFFTQSLALALGAVPVYLLARARLDSPWSGALLGAIYLAHPAISFTNLENYHPDSYLGVFVAVAIYAAIERRWRTYAVAVALAILVKEDVVLVVVPLGFWVILHRDRRRGFFTLCASVAVTLIGMLVVMRSLIGVPTRNGWRIPFGGPFGFVETVIRNPTQIADHFRSEGRPWYLWQMLVPTGFVFVRRWGVAAISGVVLFTNVLSTFWYQFHIQYHYSLIAVPALVMGSVHALATAPLTGRWNRSRLLGIMTVAAAASAYAWAPLPLTNYEMSYWLPSHPSAVAAREIIDEVPEDASVSAHYALTPHLAHRREIYEFPNPFRVRLYGVDIALENTRIDDRAERVDYLVLQTVKSPEVSADFQQIADAFVLVSSNGLWELWRRDRSVPLPPLDLSALG